MRFNRKRKRQEINFRRIAAFLLAVLTGISLVQGTDFGISGRAYADESDGGFSGHVIDTVSPNHVKFNLFDYWLVDKDTPANPNGNDTRPVQGGINKGHAFLFGGNFDWGDWNSWTGEDSHGNAKEESHGIRYGTYSGIVKNTLEGGYPVLNLTEEFTKPPQFVTDNGLQNKYNESLAYLFDPDISHDGKQVYENVQGLVKYDDNGGYIYDSHENFASFKEQKNYVGSNGEDSAGYFDVYDSWALNGNTSPNGQFFPFDSADEVFVTGEGGELVSKEINPTNPDVTNLNHFFGLTMETVFLQPEGGKIDDDTPMQFRFSGDDDVWVFIDGVLVSDLGGVHDECFTVIDFETGKVYTGLTPIVDNGDETFSEAVPTIEELRDRKPEGGEKWTWYDRTPINPNDQYGERKGTVTGDWEEFEEAHNIQTRTLKEIFDDAGASENQTWGSGEDGKLSSNTFDQNTQHELKMFYLERGAGTSNLVLSFNMLAVPASGITKTDQDGRPVRGAEFELLPAKMNGKDPVIGDDGLYAADEAKSPICSGTTDENGTLSFVTDKRKIISFQELANEGQKYFVLKETKVPTGYRSKGDISLYYSVYNDNGDGVLLSHNYWKTGTYTQAKLDVTMTNELYEYELGNDGTPVARTQIVPDGGENPDEYLDNGIIFAVPIMRDDVEGSLYEESNYHALYGTTNTGWTMMTETIEDKASVLEAAKNMEERIRDTHQSGSIIAERNARNLFHVEITNIPGDVKLSYPYLMDSGEENDSRYNIAFYFVPNADTLDEVNPNDIVRIAAADSKGNMFERQYASQFYVPDAFNRIRVQKLDYHGDRLKGAQFRMYQTYSTEAKEGYEHDESKEMYRNPAVVNDDGTLRSREEILKAVAWDKSTTKSGGTAAPGSLDLDGAFIFPSAFDEYVFRGNQSQPYEIKPNDTRTYMEEGEYVILETTAPSEGYLVNDEIINVTVNEDGVFADAGEINDGVRVGQYAGWILNSMTQFAYESPVDETLTFVTSTLKVIGDDGKLKSPEEGEISWLNKYSNEFNRYTFFAEDLGRYITDGRNLYQFTDEGTPKLEMKQNSEVTPKVLILKGEYEGTTTPVTVNKEQDGEIYPLQGNAENGVLAFWLRDGQIVKNIEVEGKVLSEEDYLIYEPNVEDLSDQGDISGLFSTETLVQVYDQSVGKLKVTKKIENVQEGSGEANTPFFYRVYSVYDNATRIILAKTDESGDVLADENGKPVIDTGFTGTLNVRLRERTEGADSQKTATNIAVDFKKGEGLIYLRPEYEVEYVYIPQNEAHGAYGDVGLVAARITLDDTASGMGDVTERHVAFDDRTRSYDAQFTGGEGIVYHHPDYTIERVTINGKTYSAEADEGGASMTVTSRFNDASINDVQNLDIDSSVSVSFDGAGDVITKSEEGPGRYVTVTGDGENGYSMEYGLSSDTLDNGVVAQFALYGGQSIEIEGLAAGTVYYVYEYAAGTGDDAGRGELVEKWDTGIAVPSGGDDVDISLQYPDYRAASGTIGTGTEKNVTFTNTFKTGSLTIEKEVHEGEGEDGTGVSAPETFTFTVTLTEESGTPLTGSYPYTGGVMEGSEAAAPAKGTLTLDADGKGNVTLSDGQRVTLNGLPPGTKWTVEETGAGEGCTTFVTTTDGAEGGQVSTTEASSASGDIAGYDEEDIAAFANNYGTVETGDLMISKTVTGEGAPEGEKFDFTVTLTNEDGTPYREPLNYSVSSADGSGTGETTSLNSEDGSYTLQLAGGETVIIEDLPEGIHYEISEADYTAEGYARIAGYSGEINSEAFTPDIEFVNVYNAGGGSGEEPDPGEEPDNPSVTPDPDNPGGGGGTDEPSEPQQPEQGEDDPEVVPDNPSEGEEDDNNPDEDGKTGDKEAESNVKTGDESHLGLWMALLIAACTLFVLLFAAGKKRYHK